MHKLRAGRSEVDWHRIVNTRLNAFPLEGRVKSVTVASAQIVGVTNMPLPMHL